MRRLYMVLAVAVTVLGSPIAVLAQSKQLDSSRAVPRLINITGVFRPADGQPPAAVETVTLSIYANQEDGMPLWQETQTVTLDERGRYSLLLGATLTDGIPSAVFASGARWLATRFERAGEVEGSRVRITSVPYALRASDADTLAGRPASDYLRAGAADVRAAGSTSHQQSFGATLQTVFPGYPNYLSKYVTDTDIGPAPIYETGGQMGIGTASPLDQLHVRFTNTAGGMTGLAVQNLGNTATSYSGMLFYDQNGVLGQFQGFNNVTHEYRINNVARNGVGAFDGSINFMIGGSSKFVVANSGNVGIGYSPQSSFCKLCVAGSVSNVVYGYNPTLGGVGVQGGAAASPGGGGMGGIGVYGWASQGAGVYGESNTSGIGVWGRAADGTAIYADSIAGTALEAYSSGSAPIATFNGPGGVGIGTSNPADKLHVAGDIRVGTDTTGCIKDADATVIAGTCSSDARLKKNITPFSSALGRITQLQPVYFDWRREEFPDRHLGTTRSFGLIAQEVEGVLPELVTTDAEGYKAVKYNQLPFYMLQAIKDLKTENDVLKQQLKLQEGQFSERLRRLELLIGK